MAKSCETLLCIYFTSSFLCVFVLLHSFYLPQPHVKYFHSEHQANLYCQSHIVLRCCRLDYLIHSKAKC